MRALELRALTRGIKMALVQLFCGVVCFFDEIAIVDVDGVGYRVLATMGQFTYEMSSINGRLSTRYIVYSPVAVHCQTFRSPSSLPSPV